MPPGVPLLQHPLEWLAFTALLRSRPVLRVLEIGSFYGGSLKAMMELCSDVVFVSVDLPVPESDPRHALMRECRALWQSWADARHHTLVNFEGDSHAPEVRERVAAHGPFDVLFIDGDHSYPGVCADWLNYAPLVKAGGLIAFHDVIANPNVERLWAEITGPKLTLTAGPDAAGIGLYFVSP